MKRPPSSEPNLSAACGAWLVADGRHAHSHCTGEVNLPPPLDICECPCHSDEQGSAALAVLVSGALLTLLLIVLPLLTSLVAAVSTASAL